jgi:hypothetical protein
VKSPFGGYAKKENYCSLAHWTFKMTGESMKKSPFPFPLEKAVLPENDEKNTQTNKGPQSINSHGSIPITHVN